RERTDLILLATTYWSLGGKPNEVDRSIEQTRMGHACEWETSMMLRIAPHLFGDLPAVAAVSPALPFEPASQGWITKDRSAPGHIGNPRVATAEKGENIFRVFSADVVALLERVIAWDGKSWNG